MWDSFFCSFEGFISPTHQGEGQGIEIILLGLRCFRGRVQRRGKVEDQGGDEAMSSSQ
jgi:hypothetical protein